MHTFHVYCCQCRSLRRSLRQNWNLDKYKALNVSRWKKTLLHAQYLLNCIMLTVIWCVSCCHCEIFVITWTLLSTSRRSFKLCVYVWNFNGFVCDWSVTKTNQFYTLFSIFIDPNSNSNSTSHGIALSICRLGQVWVCTKHIQHASPLNEQHRSVRLHIFKIFHLYLLIWDCNSLCI